MKIAVDTNRYSDLANGNAEALGVVERADEVFMSLIVLGELRCGFSLGAKRQENERVLAAFLRAPRVSVVIPDEATTRHYADLYRQTRAQGTPLPTNDLWIAALALQHGHVLYTRDKHFEHISQLLRL